MAWPAIKRHYTQEEFRRRVASLSWPRWRSSRIMWHNTAAPSLAQWMKTADQDRAAGKVPGITRIGNLERFFRDDNHWTGCPHLFIAPDFIWEMNVLTEPGVHSPSFNGSAIGIEMIGDFEREDDDAGLGLKVKNNTIFATAILCSALGLEPTSGETDKHMRKIIGGTIFLHKQDWATTHACPGRDIADDKQKMIEEVAALMAGGDHNPDATAMVIASGQGPVEPAPRQGKVTVNDLNFRSGPGVANSVIGELNAGVDITILGEAPNGATKWLKVKSPAGHIGWVAGRFIKEETV